VNTFESAVNLSAPNAFKLTPFFFLAGFSSKRTNRYGVVRNFPTKREYNFKRHTKFKHFQRMKLAYYAETINLHVIS